MNAALRHDEEIEAMAPLIARARDVLYLGRGPDYPMALEGALKLKEISYIHAEGYAAGEMKHGPIALIDDNVPVIVLAPSGPLFEKTVSNMQEVQARGGPGRADLRCRGSRAGERRHDRDDRDAKVHPLIVPLVYADPSAAPRLSCRGGEGHGRRSAAQSRQVGDGGVRSPDGAALAR
jgi:glucosamine--fructose-6-phosphate aminotransferase (isomerizing)